MAEDSTLPEDSTVVDDEGGGTSGGNPAQPNFLEGVTTALGLIGGLAAVGAAAEQFGDLFNSNTAPSNFPVPDLANNGSFRMGIQNATGGMFGTGNMVGRVPPSPAPELADAGIPSGTWEAIDFNLNRTLSMDWQVKNADPGNPNILEAYRFAGRAFTQDGGTGQFSWAAAFATWVLVKSGFHGLRTMSPMAFRKFGGKVDFHGGPLQRVRKWDIVVFTSSANIQHVGFVQGYDRRTQTLKILGGDQGETVKVTDMPYSVTNPLFRVTHIRRNWSVPAEYNVPLWELSAAPSRPAAAPAAAQTDPAPAGATEADLLGGDQAASDAAFGQGPSGQGASGFEEQRPGAPAATSNVDTTDDARAQRTNAATAPAAPQQTSTSTSEYTYAAPGLEPSSDQIRQPATFIGNDVDNRTETAVSGALDRRMTGDALSTKGYMTQQDRLKTNSDLVFPSAPTPGPNTDNPAFARSSASSFGSATGSRPSSFPARPTGPSGGTVGVNPDATVFPPPRPITTKNLNTNNYVYASPTAAPSFSPDAPVIAPGSSASSFGSATGSRPSSFPARPTGPSGGSGIYGADAPVIAPVIQPRRTYVSDDPVLPPPRKTK